MPLGPKPRLRNRGGIEGGAKVVAEAGIGQIGSAATIHSLNRCDGACIGWRCALLELAASVPRVG